MPNPLRSRTSWLGFLIGLLAILLPLAGYLLMHRPHERGAAKSSQPIDHSVDAVPLRTSGESLIDPEPLPDSAVIRHALSNAERLLRGFHIDPFGGSGTDSLRLFALEVECWHGLAAAAASDDPAHASSIEREVRSRLERFLDPPKLEERIRAQGSLQGMLEILLLAGRCRDHGIDPAPLNPLIRSLAGPIGSGMDRLPAPTAAMYAASLSALGIDVGRPLSRYVAAGVIASRPREIEIGSSSIYGITQEIFARTAGGVRPLTPTDPSERAWLERVLPYLEMACTLLRSFESAGDLLSCLHAAGLDETHGYREGLRALVARQNPDGSFGDAAGTGRARVVALLAPTSSAIAALSIDVSQRGRSPQTTR